MAGLKKDALTRLATKKVFENFMEVSNFGMEFYIIFKAGETHTTFPGKVNVYEKNC